MFLKTINKFSNSKKIKDTKNKRLKIREDLRKLRRGNNYLTIKITKYTDTPEYISPSIKVVFGDYNMSVTPLTDHAFTTVYINNLIKINY